MSLTDKFLEYLEKKRSSREIRISTSEAGISVESTDHLKTLIPWDQINRIVAFKRDTYASDVVCLLVEQTDGGVLEVNEQTPGWAEVVQELPTHLPGARPYGDWFQDVAFPAFEVSPANVFVRP